MAGVDTVRGINYQHCHAILTALDVLGDDELAGIRVEGTEDLLDIEVHALAGAHVTSGEPAQTVVVRALQVKSRIAPYTWSRGELATVLRRWTSLPLAATAKFEFVTDAPLGPSGQAVADALLAAEAGDTGALGDLLATESGDSLRDIASRVSVRAEAGTVEGLLLEAEREVRSQIAGGRNRKDVQLEGEAAVTRLFRLLSLRAGERNESDRFVSRAEIADVVGGVSGLRPADRWLTALRHEYLKSLAALPQPAAVHPKLSRWDERRSDAEEDTIEDLLHSSMPTVLAGRTGSGKSTAAALLRHEGANAETPTVICQAEAYLAQRLDSLVADAIGAIVGRDIPRHAGRQALNDPQVIVVIDGVSETPALVRRALGAEVRPHVAGAIGARIILVGRDEIATASLMPSTTNVARVGVTSFAYQERRDLAQRVLFPDEQHTGDDPVQSSETRSRARRDEATGAAVAQVQRALGDAAGNPLLLTLGLTLVRDGASFRNRSSLYSLTIDRLAARGSTTEIHVAEAVLGIVFAHLLDTGRRYANPLEWQRLVGEAVRDLAKTGVAIDRDEVQQSLLSSGVVNAIVTGIGHTQMRGPIHDSFADYLAGVAHADNLAALPPRLSVDDEQRVLFTAEMAGVSHSLSCAVAEAIPFTLVPMSAYDRRTITQDTPREVEELLSTVLPESAGLRVEILAEGTHTVAQLIQVQDEPARRYGQIVNGYHPRIVCEPGHSPLAIAVRLWRLALRARMTPSPEARPRRPRSLSEAREQVETHAILTQSALRVLLSRVAPPQSSERLAAAIGPFGISATVRPMASDTVWGEDWAVDFTSSDEIEVTATPLPVPDDSAEFLRGRRTQTHVHSIGLEPPERAAESRVCEAINRLTEARWL